jgi:pentatricopeptide repeat protein
LKEGGGGPYRNVRPNTRSFNVVLNSWVKSGTREAGAKATDLLRRMEDMSAAHKDRINQPDIISYNTVLAAWSKSAGHDPTSSHDKDVVGKEAAYKALELLDQLERQSYRIKPDVISYNTTILAFANAVQTCESGVSMAKEAEGLLIRMKDQGITPVDYSYNGVLLAWSRSSGGMSSAQHCESILRSMKHPTNISWSTVINAYAQAGGAQEAAALLKEMEEGRSADLPIVVYNNVIHAWSRSSDPNASKNAEAILNRLESGSNGLKLPKPDIISYRLTLNALEHTKDPVKADRAKSVLDRFMVSLRTQNQPLSTANNQIKESIQSSYNSVLSACAYTPSNAGEQARSNAARILVEAFRDINHSVDITLGPNQESFAMFLQGCTHLFQPDSSERLLLIRSALQECCEKGLLNAKIWDKFCSVSSAEDVQTFISAMGMCDGSRFEDLPPEWSRNSVQAI